MRDVIDIFSEKRHLGDLGTRLWRRAAAVGVGALVIAAVIGALSGDHGHGFYFAYLLGYSFALTIALGGLFFVMLHHIARSGWSVVVRRVGEAVAGTIPVLALLAIPLLVGMHELYHWTHADAVAADPILQWKRPYLNTPFFIMRLVLYFAIWTWLSTFFLKRSLEQDGSGDPALSLAMQRRAAPGMLLYALTVTFASFDLLMSLDPHWFSTIYGVYVFAGGLVGFLALLPIVLVGLQRVGLLRRAVTTEHYHDIGKLLFAFTVFWAYIAFSQYMLIWYANIPEETGWYLRRQDGGWGWVGLALLFGHFLVPFIVLLSRHVKRRPGLLAAAGGWMLLMHAIDLFWLIKPEGHPSGFAVSLLDLLLLVAFSGMLVAAAAFRMRGRSLVPERDPRLDESLGFENA
jgi:hypothetical protein